MLRKGLTAPLRRKQEVNAKEKVEVPTHYRSKESSCKYLTKVRVRGFMTSKTQKQINHKLATQIVHVHEFGYAQLYEGVH